MSTGRSGGRGKTSGVQSIDRAAAVLRCFLVDGEQPDGVTGHSRGASEVAHETGLSVSTAHRMLVALTANGLLSVADGGRYRVGPLASQLAGGGVRTYLRATALPVMHRLRDDVDETVGLHELLATGERAVIDQAESHQPLHRRYTEIGTPISLALGAPSKAMLAFCGPERQAAVLGQPIPAVTRATITDPRRLVRDLTLTRKRGYALSFEERTAGVHTVAAPLWDHRPAVVGALSVSAPKARMPRRRMEELAGRVVEAAATVSELLGATDEAVRRAVTALAETSR